MMHGLIPIHFVVLINDLKLAVAGANTVCPFIDPVLKFSKDGDRVVPLTVVPNTNLGFEHTDVGVRCLWLVKDCPVGESDRMAVMAEDE